DVTPKGRYEKGGFFSGIKMICPYGHTTNRKSYPSHWILVDFPALLLYCGTKDRFSVLIKESYE
ncbi:hypothetical protein ACFL5Z_05030, partial [Planctomycetota bacterium]